MVTVAVIDDWQGIASGCADWSTLGTGVTVRFHREPLGSEAASVAALGDCDILVPMRERTRFTAALLEQLPRLRLLAVTGKGLRHVDVETCQRRGILCCASGIGAPEVTAEYTLGLMLAATRRIASGDAAMRAGGFQSGITPGFALAGSTLGVIGMGKLGKRVAHLCRSLDMKVLGWGRSFSPEQATELGVECVSKEDLLRRADIVTVHLASNAGTRNFLGAAELALMKPGALLVNTSRGPIVNEAALLAALQAGRLQAALDVFDQEPLPADHPLRSAPNTLLTPHLGFNVRAVFDVFYQQSLENIHAFLRREPLRVLNPEALPKVRWLAAHDG